MGIAMSRIGIFFAEGYEEIEALTVVDLVRRAGIDIDMISVYGEKSVKGSHGIVVEMDKTLEETDFDGLDMLVLPGGLQGTQGLEACEELMKKLDAFYAAGKYIAAICAAPSIFGHRGYLKGRRATSYPGFESHLEGAVVTHGAAEVDGHVITGRGMGCSIPFGLAIVEQFAGKDEAEKLADKIVWMNA